MRYLCLLLTVGCLTLLSLISLIAADTPAVAPAPDRVNAPGWLGLLPLVTPVVIYILRQLAGRLPPALWPVLAGALPALAEYLVAGHASEFTGIAALLGLSGVGVREVTNQLIKSVMPASPPPPTGGPSGAGTRMAAGGSMAFAAGLLVLCTGCANVHQHARTTLPDGTVNETSIDVSAMGDARQVVSELRASNGKTQSLGAKGIEQESSLAGLVKLVEGIAAITGSSFRAGSTGGASAIRPRAVVQDEEEEEEAPAPPRRATVKPRTSVLPGTNNVPATATNAVPAPVISQ